MISTLKSGEKPISINSHIFVLATPVLTSIKGLDLGRFESFMNGMIPEFPMPASPPPPPPTIKDEIRDAIQKSIANGQNFSNLCFSMKEMQNSLWIFCQKERVSHDERVKAFQYLLDEVEKKHHRYTIAIDISDLSRGDSLNKLGTWLTLLAERKACYEVYSRAKIH